MAFQDVMQNLQLVDIFYPPGSYYETSDSDFDPNIRWGGIWELEMAGQVHVSAGTGYAIGATGGEATHTLTVDEMPSHRHHSSDDPNAAYNSLTTSGAHAVVANPGTTSYWRNITPYNGWTQYSGDSQAHNNMQPYIVVNRWHRIR